MELHKMKISRASSRAKRLYEITILLSGRRFAKKKSVKEKNGEVLTRPDDQLNR